MDQYAVKGMHCAACAARVEKAVSKVEGVESCAVSLLTNTMGVEGSASPEAIVMAVKKAGYSASLRKGAAVGRAERGQNAGEDANSAEDLLADTDSSKLKKRLLLSLGFLLVLMYISMGHMMWDFPLPGFLSGNHLALALFQMILSAVIMLINYPFFVSGFSSLLRGTPNMDTLVAMGSGVSFAWSTAVIFVMTGALTRGDHAALTGYTHELYFESAAMIVTLITVGKLLEARSKGRTTSALKALMALSPKTAVRVVETEQGRVEETVPAEAICIGDLFIVRPGEAIPADGEVVSGSGAVNEASLTGESIPADKEVGGKVFAGTVNQSGYLECRALKVGENTALSQIIEMVSSASATKAPIAKTADKVSGVFVPVVMGIALLTFLMWTWIGLTSYGEGLMESALLSDKISFALARAISVLVISCPCALGLATPVAIMVGSGMGARSGILFKTAACLEEAGKTQIVVLDKTGTITKGKPEVTDVVSLQEGGEERLLEMAEALEKRSEHPLGKAVVRFCETRRKSRGAGEIALEIERFQALIGNGVEGMLEGERLLGGSLHFMEKEVSIPEKLKDKAERLSEEGKTPLLFASGETVLGLIAVADTIKEDSAEAISQLQNMGIRVIMLTGDNEKTAQAIGKAAGVDAVMAGLLPDKKEEVVRSLQSIGKVMMVGDGINDAPALMRADIGVGIGQGTDIAIDAADIVLVKSRLIDVAAAVRIGRKTLINIYENLFWAFIYNLIGIPLAAGLFIPIFGWRLTPMFGAAAMSLSSFSVVTNALRLNLLDPYETKRDKKIKKEIEPAALKTYLKHMKERENS